MNSGVSDIFKDPYQWYAFQEYVTTRGRYVLSGKHQDFLEGIAQIASRKTIVFPKNHSFFRARVGAQPQKTVRDQVFPRKPFHGKDIGIAPPSYDNEGRLNPRGITYLYLAEDENTAIAEAKPFKGALVSVGTFRLRQEVNLVDFSDEQYKGFFLPADLSQLLPMISNPSPQMVDRIIWAQINREFSKPVSPDETMRDYIPTQILAEFLREKGFEGVVYKSAMSSDVRRNIVLFNKHLVMQARNSSRLFEVNDIHVSYRSYESSSMKRMRTILEGM